MWFFIAILILLCTYVAENKKIDSDSRTMFFSVVIIIGLLGFLFGWILR